MDDGSENLITTQAALAHVFVHHLADAWQGACEGQQPPVFRFIANTAPVGMITVLLASARVASRRLYVAVRRGADPHIRPGGRNCELADASRLGAILQRLARRRQVPERT